MPYKRVGRKIMSKSGGRWHKKQVGRTLASAKRALRLLNALHHGFATRRK